MKKQLLYNIMLAALVVLMGSCSDSDSVTSDFTVVQDGMEISTLQFNYTAGKKVVGLTTNVEWSVACDQEWCTLSNRSGDPLKEAEKYYLVINVTANDGVSPRTANITFNAGGQTHSLTVIQAAYDPSLRPANMRHSATQLMKLINVGWNIGNTLEATGGETSWGNPLITRDLIRGYKALGINALRLPCAWDSHADDGGNIDAQWMARVKEVIDWIVAEDMYVMLNIHWDGGWMEEHCGTNNMTENEIAQVNEKVRSYWTQIATEFRDYDEHLLFACANEPAVDNAAQMAVLARYEQTFVDAVRATGGNNEFRVLVVEGPSTDITQTLQMMTMPTDATPESLALEVHFYSPWWFVVNVDDDYKRKPTEQPYLTWFWGKDYIQYGAHDEMQEEQMMALFQQMKARYVDRGIPVIVGECGSDNRECPNATWPSDDFYQHFLDSRVYYHRFMVEQMKNNGMTPFIWDTGKWISRYDYTATDSRTVQAVIEGANAGIYPF